MRWVIVGSLLLAASSASAQVLPGGQEQLVRRLLTVHGCALERAQVWPEEVRGALVCDGESIAVRLVHPSRSEAPATRGAAVLVEPTNARVETAVRANLERDDEALRWMEPRPPDEPTPEAPAPTLDEAPEPEPPPRDWTHAVTGGLLLLGWIGVARAR